MDTQLSEQELVRYVCVTGQSNKRPPREPGFDAQ